MGPSRNLIVLIDDEPEVLRSLERALRQEPYEIVSTSSPSEVLRLICERSVDLIISDQRMPEMNGTDLLEVVRDYSPDTACVILTAFPDTAVVLQESGLRLERLMTKPWDNADLKATIRRILDARPPRPTPSADVPVAAPKGMEVGIDCSNRDAREVVAEILLVCARAREKGDPLTIVLKNPRLVGDSLARLLKGLARAVAWSHFPIEVRDDSGCVSAFLTALGNRESNARN